MEEEDEAFLFEERGGGRKAVTREPLELPPSEKGWVLLQTFTLGVQHVMPIDLDPEPVLRALFAEGFYVWDPATISQPKSTGQ